jgi:hypothetical protein
MGNCPLLDCPAANTALPQQISESFWPGLVCQSRKSDGPAITLPNKFRVMLVYCSNGYGRLLSNTEKVEAKMGILGNTNYKLGIPGDIQFSFRPGYRSGDGLSVGGLAVVLCTGDYVSGPAIFQVNSL